MSDQAFDTNPDYQHFDKAESINYQIPERIQSGQIHQRAFLSTLQGGKIIIDEDVKMIWQAANQHSLPELLNDLCIRFSQDEIRSILACLVQAGVLTRGEETSGTTSHPVQGKLVSAVIVAFNGREWLPDCLTSLLAQTYSPIEMMVVDNFSTDDSIAWLESTHPDIRLLRLDKAVPLSKAINAGVASATGDYFLVLNQDIQLEPNAVAEMVEVAKINSDGGAVATKLKYMWAPAFLNGLGNWVRDYSWGSDIGLGNLDFGQFDDWTEVPSACFAGALIPRSVWSQVGPIDEGFPLYYEDSDWSYRTRMLGFKILAAPKAVIYHAFGGKVPTGIQGGVSVGKQRMVSYGRMRFALKIVGSNHLFHFLKNYFFEDWANFIASFVRGRFKMSAALLSAWYKLIADLPGILKIRRMLQSQRKTPDEILFAKFPELPETLEWNGLPVLTRDIIKRVYLPLFRFKRNIRMPEFERPPRRPQLLMVISNDGGNNSLEFYTAIGKALCLDMDVTLAIPGEIGSQLSGIRMVSYDVEHPLGLQILVENQDIALISGSAINKYPFLKTTKTRLIVDLINTTQLDNLIKNNGDLMPDPSKTYVNGYEIINNLARAGDFFICSSERQRDQWLGVLAANGRLNQDHIDLKFSADSLIDIVHIDPDDKENGSAPLRKYCLEGGYAPDRQKRFWMRQSLQDDQTEDAPPMGKIEESLFIWRTRGFTAMINRISLHLRWLFLHR